MRPTEITTLQPLFFRSPYIQIPYLGADLWFVWTLFKRQKIYYLLAYLK